MNDVAQPYTRRRIRALYPIIRDDHLRLLERGNLIRPDRRARHEPVYTFADLRVIRDVASRLEAAAPFRAVLRTLLSAQHGQLALDFQPTRGEVSPEKVVAFARHASTPGSTGAEDGGSARAAEYFHEGARLDGEAGHQDAAMAAYRRTLALDPTCVPAMVNLANLHYTRDALAEAQALYEQAIRTDPTCFESHFNLGHVLHDLEQYRAAATAYAAALDLRPAYADAHFYLAVTLEKLGCSADAKPHWRAYQQLAPSGEWVELAREFSEE
ncbi:MAG: tetratricopeptide repeat protein [Vicinamibacterales bacterium]